MYKATFTLLTVYHTILNCNDHTILNYNDHTILNCNGPEIMLFRKPCVKGENAAIEADKV